MRKEIPEEVSQRQITFDVEELEAILCPPPMNLPDFEPAYIELKDGSKMLIRSLRKEEAKPLMNYVGEMMKVERDFYDIVGARVYSEILGWLRNRLKDSYQFVGLINGEAVGFANGRLMNEDINISLHSLALKRGSAIGAIMYYCKCYYAFEQCNQKEFWATYESYNGFKRWGMGMAQPSYPWPQYQHELGGARVFYVTKDYWNASVKKYLQHLIKGELKRPVPAELLKANENFTVPKEILI